MHWTNSGYIRYSVMRTSHKRTTNDLTHKNEKIIIFIIQKDFTGRNKQKKNSGYLPFSSESGESGIVYTEHNTLID